MKKFIVPAFVFASTLAFAQDTFVRHLPSQISLEEQISKCESERKILRGQILVSQYFSQFNAGKSGDEIEALIYSVGNFLTYGTAGVISHESALQTEGRQLASASNLDDDGVSSLKAYIKNRNLLNSLHTQWSQVHPLINPI